MRLWRIESSMTSALPTPLSNPSSWAEPTLSASRNGQCWAGADAEIGVAFLVACYSALRRAAPQPGLIDLGDLSIQGMK